MSVSDHTVERLSKAKAELDAAAARVRNAQSQWIDAERRYNDAARAWECEFFAKVDKRVRRLRQAGN